MFDVLIKNGKVVNHTDIVECDIAVKDGKIAALGKNLGQAEKEIDAKGNYVMPGAIDPHTHIGLFIKPFEKDLKSESGAAAAAGTTTMLHCLIGNEPIMDQYNTTKEAVPGSSYCDVGFYAALLTDDDLSKIKELSSKGVNSYKFLMAYKGKEAETIGLEDVNIDNGFLYRACEIIKKTGGLPMIHAENIEVVHAVEEKYKGKEDSLEAWAKARPNLSEEIDVYSACMIAEEVGVPLYQVHSSVGTIPDIVREFRHRGNEVFLEACPHYFVTDYTGSNLKEPKLGKINPPIRSPQDRELILENLANSEYDCIGTDSANSMYEDKVADGSIWNMVLDFSSVDYMMPLVLSELVNKDVISLPDAVRMTSYNTARIHGLYPQKGVLAIGSDADIIIVDLNKEKEISPEKTKSSADYSLYDGWNIKGWPILTMVRGEVVVDNDNFVAEAGHGELVACKPAFKN